MGRPLISIAEEESFSIFLLLGVWKWVKKEEEMKVFSDNGEREKERKR